MAKLLVLNGPNLNLLGKREPGITAPRHWNRSTSTCSSWPAARAMSECFQSNREYELIERVHAAGEQGVAFIIINPAAFTHTSIALRDALLGVKIPFIEVHLSNVHARETFRHHSYFSDVAVGVIAGLGAQGYELALQAAIRRISQ
ncbi:MAG: type II 3-dehydroquinate dehydratase [Gammaproteobacteria bacterium]